MSSKEELLKYKFELEVAYDGLGRGLDIADVKDAISLGIVGYEKMLNLLFNPKPYKLEDLKEDMWVYDIKYDEFCRIDFIAGIYPHRSYSDGTCEDGAFEENRFFPVQMANMINIEKKGERNNESDN